MSILSSSRLILKEFTKDDAALLFALDSDPDVMKYLGTPVKTIDDVLPGLERCTNYYKNNPGFGVWAAYEKESNNFIGWFCLKALDGGPEIEVGYRLLKAFWGKGYATEMSLKLIDYGFGQMKLERIAGITHPGNIASQSVLKKAGLTYERQAHYYKTDVLYFSINKAKT